MTRPAALAAARLLAAALVATAPPAGAWVHVTTPGGVPIAWDQRCIGWWMQADGSADLPWDDAWAAVAAGFATWDAVEAIFVDFEALGATCFDGVGGDAWPGDQNVVIWREGPGSWPYAARVVALTSVTFNRKTGRLVDADIELNGEDYGFRTDGSPFAFDLQSTMTHEIGHLLGLGHSEDRDAVMYARSEPGQTDKRVLRPDDLEAIALTHPADDPPDTPACGPGAAAFSPAEPWCPPEPPDDDGCAGSAPAPGAPLPLALALAALAALARRRRAAQALGLAVALLALAPAPPAAACTPYRTSAGQPLFWRATALATTLDPELPAGLDADEVEEVVARSLATWSDQPCWPIALEVAGWAQCPSNTGSDRVNCLRWIDQPNLWPVPTHVVAATWVHFVDATGEIVDADTDFNAAFFPWSTDLACDDTTYDFEATLTHETGHLLGLDHSAIPTATMEASTFPGDCAKRTLDDDDRDCYCATYTDLPPAPPEPEPDAGGDTAGAADAGPDAPAGGGGGGGGRDGCAGGPAPGAPLAWLLATAALAARRRRPRTPARARAR